MSLTVESDFQVPYSITYVLEKCRMYWASHKFNNWKNR
jgi:hypothetical protein